MGTKESVEEATLVTTIRSTPTTLWFSQESIPKMALISINRALGSIPTAPLAFFVDGDVARSWTDDLNE
eukprot:scaffold818_cov136-Cylindrotheca_fusiformis.AAC.42